MIKSVLARVAATTLVGAGLVAVPAVVGFSPVNAAPKTNCAYDPVNSTSVSISASPTAGQAGSSYTITATASTTVGTLPAGTIKITRYKFVNDAWVSDGVVATGASPTVNYNFVPPTADATYRFDATYETPNCDYADSTSQTSAFVSVYKYATKTTLTSETSATVTAPNRAAGSTIAKPDGTVTFNYEAKPGKTCTVAAQVGEVDQETGIATVTGLTGNQNSSCKLGVVTFTPDAASSSYYLGSSDTNGTAA